MAGLAGICKQYLSIPLARHDVGSLLAESQASALTVPTAQRDQAFTAAVTTCFVAGVVSSRAGNIDLAATAAQRGYNLAQQHDNPALVGFARWYWALELTSMVARTRAHAVLVGAEPVIHGGELWYHWTVVIGHDRWS